MSQATAVDGPEHPRPTRLVHSISLTATSATRPGSGASLFGTLVTDEPAFVVSPGRRITSWNAPLERLTARVAGDVVGRPCDEVMAAISHGAGPRCCSHGCPFPGVRVEEVACGPDAFELRTPAGPRRVELTTITGDGRELMHLVHVLQDDGDISPGRSAGELTPRQLEVLSLLHEGVTCDAIAHRLVLSSPTVRNHIRAILRALGSHSQIEAVAEARRRGLV